MLGILKHNYYVADSVLGIHNAALFPLQKRLFHQLLFFLYFWYVLEQLVSVHLLYGLFLL